MIYYLLLVASIVLAVAKSSLYNAYAKGAAPTLSQTLRFNAASYGVAAAVAFVTVLLSDFSFSPPTVICALFYAVIVFSLQTISILAMKTGAMSLTAICVMYGMILPTLAGPLFWKEPIGILQGVGVGLMLFSLWFLKQKEKKTNKKTTLGWAVAALVAFLLSGAAGVMEKIHQSTDGREEKAAFVCLACFFMLSFSVVATLLTRRKSAPASRSRVLLPVVSGVVVGLYSTVNLTLAGNLPSVVYFPIANGGAMLLTVAVSALLFKERFGLRQWIGVVLGLSGIVLLSLPIE